MRKYDMLFLDKEDFVGDKISLDRIKGSMEPMEKASLVMTDSEVLKDRFGVINAYYIKISRLRKISFDISKECPYQLFMTGKWFNRKYVIYHKNLHTSYFFRKKSEAETALQIVIEAWALAALTVYEKSGE